MNHPGSARRDATYFSATLAAAALRGITRGLRWHIRGLEHWEGGAVLICWHGEILLGGSLLLHLGRAGECWAPIVPEYGQSEAMTRFAAELGLRPFPVPGYERPAERRSALESLIPAMHLGESVFLAADGHRAPRLQPVPDPLWLARAAGVPLLPVALDAHPRVVLPTWDRKRLPLPGARAAAVLGEPVDPREDLSFVSTALDRLASSAQRLTR